LPNEEIGNRQSAIGNIGNVPFTSERAMRLPRTFWNYSAPLEASPVNELPALTRASITFGCLNLYCKVTKPMLRLWAQVLSQVPRSRLILHSFRGAHRERAQEVFGSAGVDLSRLEFADRATPREYFLRYHQIDIALDTSPYPGGATTCDALWMGVPVVTLAGRTALSRGGVSIVSNVGLPELVARNEQEYLQIAAGLANDLPRLSELRKSMRARMQSSPLMEPVGFARDLEAAYRQMWIAFTDAIRTRL
jgi:predicted O-linked N-acetylglucosamine transferase (SPINDLY family)